VADCDVSVAERFDTYSAGPHRQVHVAGRFPACLFLSSGTVCLHVLTTVKNANMVAQCIAESQHLH
jgi:hypothetical protein